MAFGSGERGAARVRSGVPVRGEVRVPPSKSVTHRVVLLALLGGRRVLVERALLADDTERLITAVEACGWRVDRRTDATTGEAEGCSLVLEPGARPVTRASIDCGGSGTLLRLLLGVLAARPGSWMLDGAPRLRERPVGALVTALRELGSDVDYGGDPGFAPLRIRGRVLPGGRVRLDASESSQYLSALILAALAAEGPTSIEVERLTSAPYVDLTRTLVARWGGRLEVEEGGGVYRVWPGLEPPERIVVEGDDSSAAYFAAAAAVTGGEVRLRGLGAASAQGDRRFLDLLERMGAGVTVEEDAIRVAARHPLRAVDVDLGDMPDQVPTLAALAPFARGTTRIRGVPHLRLKESDRLGAMATELRRVGASAEERSDGLEIPGIWHRTEPPCHEVLVDTHDDHRIAMSLALVALRRPGLAIARPEVVTKSYPRFWEDLAGVLGAAS